MSAAPVVFEAPTRVFFGRDAFGRLEPPAGPVLVFLGSGVPSLDSTLTDWKGRGVEPFVIRKPAGEPWSSEVDRIHRDVPKKLNAVVAVGGGSTLDFAKALAILSASGGAIADYEFGQRKISEVRPLFLAPTTCGSGSEVTPYCVVNNSTTRRKFTLGHPALRAVQAANDPSLLGSLSGPARLATALDAFTHCLEALLNKSGSNIVEPIAREGLAIAWRRMADAAARSPTDDALEELARLSLYGGIAIAHNRTGLIHTLSVAFAQFVDIPHGLLNARLLPFAIKHNLPEYQGRLAHVLSAATGRSFASDAAASEALTAWVGAYTGSAAPAPSSEIRERGEAIVARLLQDSGLPSVSHGPIDRAALSELLERMIDEIG